MAVAIAVRRSSPLRWLHRLNRPKTPRYSEALHAHRPPAAYAANVDRWATLPGEYDDDDRTPSYVTLPPLAGPGLSAAVACIAGGPTVLHLSGTWRGRVIFEGSTDGRIWQPIALLSLTGDVATEATCPSIWRTVPYTPVRLLRLHVISLTAGSVMPVVAGIPHAGAGCADADCIEAAA